MKIKIFAFTENGRALALKIAHMCGEEASVSDKKSVTVLDFTENDALVFVGAAGIAVRLTAPFIKDKLTDPAVVVIDEKAKFVIPILSGHVGGANELSDRLAVSLGAISVLTTATDVNGVIAVDEFAAKNGLKIRNRENIKKVSSGLLKGKPVNISFADDVVITGSDSEIDEQVLGLVYAPLIVGLGMRKGIHADKLEKFFLQTLAENSYSPWDVSAIASIDIKKDEAGLNALIEKYNIPAYWYCADELNRVEGSFEESEFVRKTVGCGDVSARAAAALGKTGTFIVKKKKEDGMTISLFRKNRRITFEY